MQGTIGWAVKQLLDGERLIRAGWNGKGMWIALQWPDENSKMTEPYIYIEYPEKSDAGLKLREKPYRIPWLCSQADLLATDWQVF